MSIRTHSLLVLTLAACVVGPVEPGESATGTTSGTASASGTSLPGTTTAGPLTTSGSDSDSTGSTLPTTGTTLPTTGDPDPTATSCGITCPLDMPLKDECDTWTQDCPPGDKCMPYSSDGDDTWDHLKCVKVVRDPAGLYEPCTLGPIATGEDTCDVGLMCWFTDDNSEGICVGMCTGTPDMPACTDPGASCVLGGDSVLTLCLPICDPLTPDCPADHVCLPSPIDPDAFLCVIDASGDGGQTFDPCEFANACDPGHVCLDPAVATECDAMATGCCAPYCDTTQPNTCPGAGQQCLPWFEPGQAPAGHEDLGICSLPMP